MDSFLRLNVAKNNGGSILVQHSKVFIFSTTFSNESAVLGFGGAICAENVANVTVRGSLFYHCKAHYGGSVSVQLESVVRIDHSNIVNSYGWNEEGGVHILHFNFLIGYNLTVTAGRSKTGAGLHIGASSKINLEKFTFSRNSAWGAGGAIYCTKSKVTLVKGILFDNSANNQGGGVFGDTCDATFDQSKLIQNTGLFNGGGIFFVTSLVEIHNTEGVNNTNNSGVIAEYSLFQSKYLHLSDAHGNCITISNNSVAQMEHTYLSNLQEYCPIVAKTGSKINIDYIYFTDQYYSNKLQVYSNESKYVVCADGFSKTHGTFEGYLCVFPKKEI